MAHPGPSAHVDCGRPRASAGSGQPPGTGLTGEVVVAAEVDVVTVVVGLVSPGTGAAVVSVTVAGPVVTDVVARAPSRWPSTYWS
jgi:hypothetical protein